MECCSSQILCTFLLSCVVMCSLVGSSNALSVRYPHHLRENRSALRNLPNDDANLEERFLQRLLRYRPSVLEDFLFRSREQRSDPGFSWVAGSNIEPKRDPERGGWGGGYGRK